MRYLLLLLLGCGSPMAPPPPDLARPVDLAVRYCLTDQDCPAPERCVGGACAVVK